MDCEICGGGWTTDHSACKDTIIQQLRWDIKRLEYDNKKLRDELRAELLKPLEAMPTFNRRAIEAVWLRFPAER